MQVDFYQLTRDPAEFVIPPIAQKIIDNGGRLLVVSGETGQLEKLSRALWEWRPESFLAHGYAETDGAENQPILMSATAEAPNGAKMIALIDGHWRDAALAFDRAFYLFAPDATDAARSAWRALADKGDVERRYWRQDGGKWRQGP